MILITTSNRPTRRIRTFCNDLGRVIPDACVINRGKLGQEGIVERAQEIGADRLIIVERWKGGPGRFKLCDSSFDLKVICNLYILGVTTQSELGQKKMVRRGLAVTIDKDAKPSVRSLASLLSKFLDVPLVETLSEDTSIKASVHFMNFKGNETRIAFTMPPKTKEIGPIFIVRNQENTELRGESI